MEITNPVYNFDRYLRGRRGGLNFQPTPSIMQYCYCEIMNIICSIVNKANYILSVYSPFSDKLNCCNRANQLA